MTIKIDRSDRVTVVTISYPPYNIINREYLQEFEETTRELASVNPDGIVFTWDGETTGYGADLREVIEHMSQSDWKEWSRDRLETVYRAAINLRNTRSRKVSVVHGDVYGGSMELPLMADYLIAEEGTTVCFPECTLGGIPGFGGTAFIFERTGAHNTKMIIFTGGMLSAELASKTGLVDEVVPNGMVMTEQFYWPVNNYQKEQEQTYL